jgi:hypothetical protein
MEKEGWGNPSQCILQKGHNKNLCIFGEDVKQVSGERRGIVIFERGMPREMRA